jgi:hypothetical protein
MVTSERGAKRQWRRMERDKEAKRVPEPSALPRWWRGQQAVMLILGLSPALVRSQEGKDSLQELPHGLPYCPSGQVPWWSACPALAPKQPDLGYVLKTVPSQLGLPCHTLQPSCRCLGGT